MGLLIAIQLTVGSPEHFERVAEALALSAAARDALLERGVVVPEGVTAPSFTNAYATLTSKQVPVLVTADSVLHACEWGLAGLDRDLEQYVFAPRLRDLLWKLWRHAPDPELGRYLAMALRLLVGPDAHFPNCPRDIDPWLAALEQRTPQTIEVFGGPRTIDPADFTPRGHYRNSPTLKNYFRAMAWLDRVEMRRSAAKALDEAIGATGERAAFEKVRVLLMFVGGRVINARHVFGLPEAHPEFLRAAASEMSADAPRVFLSDAWKALRRQTALSVGVELCVDTPAKAERAGIVGRPPALYVEPCPELFGGLAAVFRELMERVNPELEAGRPYAYLRDAVEALEALRDAASIELSGAYVEGERLRALEELEWYPKLFYAAHTDPSRSGAPDSLRPAATAAGGVGAVHYAAVIVDGVTYAGPVYSYYEIDGHGEPDESAWRARLESKPPPRPQWTRAFVK